MYKVIVEALVNVTEEVEVRTEYGDYYDSYTDEVDDPYLLKKLVFTEEDNLVEYVDKTLQIKLQTTSCSNFVFKEDKLYINSEFIAIKELTELELDQLNKDVQAQYSGGWFESGLEKNIYNGSKYKDYYLTIDYLTVTIKQTKLD